MPQMQHAGREVSILAAEPRMQETDQQIGIFETPAAESCVEAVHPVEIAPPDREIARTRPPPGTRSQLPQYPRRKWQQRREAVDLSPRPQRQPGAQAPALGLDRLRQDALGQVTRQQHAIAGDKPS